jgi:hypothetical protein
MERKDLFNKTETDTVCYGCSKVLSNYLECILQESDEIKALLEQYREHPLDYEAEKDTLLSIQRSLRDINDFSSWCITNIAMLNEFNQNLYYEI